MKGLQSAARVQTRVIWALMLRETKTLFGKHKLGYLWAPDQCRLLHRHLLGDS